MVASGEPRSGRGQLCIVVSSEQPVSWQGLYWGSLSSESAEEEFDTYESTMDDVIRLTGSSVDNAFAGDDIRDNF